MGQIVEAVGRGDAKDPEGEGRVSDKALGLDRFICRTCGKLEDAEVVERPGQADM